MLCVCVQDGVRMPEKPKDKGESPETGKPVPEGIPETLSARMDGTEVQASANEPVVAVVSAGSERATTSISTSTVVAGVSEIDEPVVATIRLEKKHTLAIRWMHWVNFPVLFTMIWSGILIYWNDSDNAYQHPHAIYRIGIGRLTLLRLFPDWFYQKMHVPYHVTEGLGYHFFFMWIFALNGIAYVLYTAISGEWRFLLPERRSLRDAVQVTL